MIEPPSRLPTDETGIAEWSVYVDALLERGDRGAELLARELALPTAPDPDALRAWHELARRAYRDHSTAPTGWCLGHARTLELPPQHRYRIHPAGADTSVVSNLHPRLRTPAFARVERLSLALHPDDDPRPRRRLFAALPPTCRTVELNFVAAPAPARVEELVATLPPSVRELEVNMTTWRGRRVPPPVAPFIIDRFDTVAFPDLELDGAAAGELGAALALTRTVQVRVFRFTAPLPWDRCVLGRGEAALLQPERGAGMVLARWGLALLQRHYGPIPVRTQLAGALPESYGIGAPDGSRVVAAQVGGDLVRRGAAWTVRAVEQPLFRNGAPIPPSAIVPLADGDDLAIGRAACTFTLDPTAAVRRWT